MNLNGPEYINTDVLVIGSGGAGLRAAIAAREKEASVLLVSKSPIGLGNNTALAGAVMAAVTGEADPRDSAQIHAQDTMVSGCFINDRALVECMTEQAGNEITNLERYGVPLDKENGKHLITRAAGHSYARSIGGRMKKGFGYTLPLKDHAEKIGVTFRQKIFISKLLLNNGSVAGAVGFDWNGNFLVFRAKSVVLAAGGLGNLYQYTNNAAGITGDGYALAYNSGIPLRDMEFVQFYPTSGPNSFMYELWILNLGAKLKNALGEDVFARNGLKTIMEMTRDHTAQAIYREISEGRGVDGGVIFDLSPVSKVNLDKYQTRFKPSVLEMVSKGQREFVVYPVCHFHMGGCVADVETRTNIEGFFAAGEVTGGEHGANRLGSNALAEIFVFGAIAGSNAAKYAQSSILEKIGSNEIEEEKQRLGSFFGEVNDEITNLTQNLQETMWKNVSIIRNEKGLKEALDTIEEIRTKAKSINAFNAPSLMRRLELDNLLLSGEMVTRSALTRTESRGSHFREDYPTENEKWLANLFITNKNGKMEIEKRPVEK